MKHFDAQEVRDPVERERALMARLPEHIAHAKANSAHYAQALAAVRAEDVISRAALAALPVIRKSELAELQKKNPPFGGLITTPLTQLGHIYASPGPIYDPEGRGADPWRFARALYAAGFRPGDLVHNTFSYHFTPAGMMVEGGAHKLGCCVFPAGVGQTEMQVTAIADLKPAAYVGTPSFLKIIVEKADEMRADISSLKKALVSGEALPAATRSLLEARGMTLTQCYATADLGLIAYETSAREGLVLDEDVILEIVRPGTGDPVAAGEVGEVIITTFNADYPLIRFGTGDLSAVLPGISPCGRTNTRIKGWLGRADQVTKIRGMFVHPSQVAQVVKRHAEIKKARLVVDNPKGDDRMTLHCEVAGSTDESADLVKLTDLAQAIAASVREVTKLRAEINFCATGSLPNDGKVIEDARKLD